MGVSGEEHRRQLARHPMGAIEIYSSCLTYIVRDSWVYQARNIVDSWQDIQWDNAAIDLHDKKRAYFDGVLSLKASIDTLSNAEMMVCCSVVQCVAVYCSVWQCVAVISSVLQCVAVCCSVLQCVAVCRSVVHCGAVCCVVGISLHPMPKIEHITKYCTVCVIQGGEDS